MSYRLMTATPLYPVHVPLLSAKSSQSSSYFTSPLGPSREISNSTYPNETHDLNRVRSQSSGHLSAGQKKNFFLNKETIGLSLQELSRLLRTGHHGHHSSQRSRSRSRRQHVTPPTIRTISAAQRISTHDNPGFKQDVHVSLSTGHPGLSARRPREGGLEDNRVQTRTWRTQSPRRFSCTDVCKAAHELKMYKELMIGLLLSGYISTSITSSTPVNGIETHETGPRKQLNHIFSEPVIIAIIWGVMAGIIGIILLFAICISKLSKKPSFNVQPSLSHDTEAPLTSVETEQPEQ
ncbi:glycophorin-A [Molossus nigricans]